MEIERHCRWDRRDTPGAKRGLIVSTKKLGLQPRRAPNILPEKGSPFFSSDDVPTDIPEGKRKRRRRRRKKKLLTQRETLGVWRAGGPGTSIVPAFRRPVRAVLALNANTRPRTIPAAIAGNRFVRFGWRNRHPVYAELYWVLRYDSSRRRFSTIFYEVDVCHVLPGPSANDCISSRGAKGNWKDERNWESCVD